MHWFSHNGSLTRKYRRALDITVSASFTFPFQMQSQPAFAFRRKSLYSLSHRLPSRSIVIRIDLYGGLCGFYRIEERQESAECYCIVSSDEGLLLMMRHSIKTTFSQASTRSFYLSKQLVSFYLHLIFLFLAGVIIFKSFNRILTNRINHIRKNTNNRSFILKIH